MKPILIVEDEPKIAQVLRDYLTKAGYATEHLAAGDKVVARVRREAPAAILLDLNLPGADGVTVCKEIRAFSTVPILMVTARVEEIDRLLGLELGADDYICKPFSPREVVARLKSVLRRTHTADAPGEVLAAGPIRLDVGRREVTVGAHALELTGYEFELLKTFLARPNQVFARAQLLFSVTGDEFEGYERTVDTHVKNLRKKLAAALPEAELIKTVYGVGYKFQPPG